MAKQTGLGDNLYVDGYDLSGDINAVDKVSGGNRPLNMTGIDKSAIERLGGEREGVIDLTALFNDAASHSHLRLGLLPTTDVIMTYCRGTAIGSSAASMVGKQVNYDPAIAQDGMLTLKVGALSNAWGLEWGNLLTAGKRVDTTATNGASFDQTVVSTAFGWTAYLHVFALTGTNVVITVQDSADNASFANITGGAFTSATGVTTQRLTAGATDTVRRYVRAITSGTFTSATFAVMFVRNATATVY